MNKPTTAGVLYVVATPIGHLADMSVRAIETLQRVDWILCEDTRHSGPMLKHFGIDKPCHALHQFNEAARFDWVSERLARGEHGALISDAGTPGIQDPGQHLLAKLWEAGLESRPIPGPCAAISALSVSGFVHETFTFVGFLPAKKAARISHIASLTALSGPVILYETARRLPAVLSDLAQTLGPLPVLLAREMTKQYESFWRTDLQTAADTCQTHWPLKGELALVIDLPEDNASDLSDAQRTILATLLNTYPLSQAVDMVVTLSGLPRNVCYQTALALKEQKD